MLGARSMCRLSSLFSELRISHSGDQYLQDAEIVFKLSKCHRSILQTYNRALSTLDKPSWELLKCKATANFSGTSSRRGKNSFFSHLNEAFAYRYLHQRGCELIAFIPEVTNGKSPDLSFMENGTMRVCEVKTIEISDEDIDRTVCGDTFDASVYKALTLPFIYDKLDKTLSRAVDQIRSREIGLVYLIVNFDDFTLRHYQTYRCQLLKFLSLKYPTLEVYIKVGIQSRKRIHHVGNVGAAGV